MTHDSVVIDAVLGAVPVVAPHLADLSADARLVAGLVGVAGLLLLDCRGDDAEQDRGWEHQGPPPSERGKTWYASQGTTRNTCQTKPPGPSVVPSGSHSSGKSWPVPTNRSVWVRNGCCSCSSVWRTQTSGKAPACGCQPTCTTSPSGTSMPVSG